MTPLAIHPTMHCASVRGVTACTELLPQAHLLVEVVIDADVSGILLPALKPARRVDFLWQHTCFEVFLGAEGSSAYHELNLSPSSEWAVYGFRAYRDIESLGEDPAAVDFNVSVDDRSLRLTARIDLARLSASYVDAPLRLAVSAVIEEHDGSLSYWSLRHPAGQPDFHHDDAFAMRV